MRPENFTRAKIALVLPPELGRVALIDAQMAAATGSVGLSWWYAKVASGEAPQPVIRMPRCTRWRAEAVADFWRRFAEQGDVETADKVKAKAIKATAAAQAKRRQSAKLGSA